MTQEEVANPLLQPHERFAGIEEAPPYEESVAPGGVAAPPVFYPAGNAPLQYGVTMVPAIIFPCAVCGHRGPNAIGGSIYGKCGNCNEVTLIGNPPPGKECYRCRCNCLLEFTAGASAVQCMRPNCKAIYEFDNKSSGVLRVQCLTESCRRLVVVPTWCGSPVAHFVCPVCKVRQYSSKEVLRSRAFVYLVIGFIFIGIGVGVTVGTRLAASNGGLYIVYFGPMVLGALYVIIALVYLLGNFSTATPYTPKITARTYGMSR